MVEQISDEQQQTYNAREQQHEIAPSFPMSSLSLRSRVVSTGQFGNAAANEITPSSRMKLKVIRKELGKVRMEFQRKRGKSTGKRLNQKPEHDGNPGRGTR